MRNPESCPAENEKCSRCIEVAKAAISKTIENSGAFSEHQSKVLAENSQVETLVQRPYIHEIFSCEERQHDAEKIGKELGSKIADDHRG
jgi:hypothetical protein